jgi:hypothetical protein
MSTTTVAYPFDPTGMASTNLVTGERQILTPPNWGDYYFILPLATPFFANSNFQAVLQPSGKVLQEGVDFVYCYRFYDATIQCAYPVYGGIYFMDQTLSGVIELQYQTLGGEWTLDSAQIATVLANQLLNPVTTTWEEVVNLPAQFPPVAHQWDIIDMTGASDIVNVLNQMVTALLQTGNSGLAAHLADFNNPHRVTAAQVGLGNVQNYGMAQASDATSGSSSTLYMSPATTLIEINTFAVAPLNAHINNTNNPHNVTATQVGLGNVNNYGWASTTDAQNGVSVTGYMNPALTEAAVAYQALTPLNAHIGNTNNPHNVTATQVGLGNVQNYPVATTSQAQAGTDNASYMTPYLVSQLLGGTSGIAGQLEAHIDNYNNPHQTTASQVGLGNVQNYGMAADADALAGTSSTLYMSPATTMYAITQQLSPYAAHIVNYDNPHEVTAAQVGLGSVQNYGIAQTSDATAGSSNVLYMTPALTAAAITSQVGTAFNAHVANYNNPHEVTAAQVGAYPTSYIDTQLAAIASDYLPVGGTAANSEALQGLSPSQLVSQVLSQLPAAPKYTYPAGTSASTPCWVPIYVQPNYTPGTPSLPPIAFYYQGGEAHTDGENSPTYYVYIDPLYPTNARVDCLAGDSSAVSFGYVLNATGGLTLYAYVQTDYDEISMLMLSDPLNNNTNAAGVAVTTRPTGYVIINQVITDPTQHLQKPGVGELYFQQSYAESRVPSFFGNGPANNAQSASLMQFLSVAVNSTDVTNAQAIETPWITEYRNMGRIAAYANEPTYAVNVNSLWSWDNTNSLIEMSGSAQQALCTLLSSEGIPSGTPYQLEVKLSSTDLGDESIGITFGYIVADGKVFSLQAVRTCGGTVVDAVNGNLPGSLSNFGLFTVGLNLFENSGVVIASNTSALTWGDGTSGSVSGHESSYVPQATTSGTNGWANKGTVRIKATYDGAGNFTLQTTDFNDTSGDYVSAAQLTFSLSSLSIASGPFAQVTGTTIFGGTYGALKWGLSCYKQASSEFGIVTSPDYYARYVDYSPNGNGTDSSALYFYTGNAGVGSSGWESIALSNGPLQPGRLLYSDVNNTIWVVRRDGTVNPLPIIAYSGSAGTQILTT